MSITSTQKEISIGQAKSLLQSIILYNLERFDKGGNHDSFIVPFFIGDPGVGKTAISRQAAKECEVPYFQTIVAQFDPGELAGLPFMGQVKVTRMLDGKPHEAMEDRMIRLRPSYLPDINDQNQQIGLYNLDELPQTTLAGQNIMSQLVNEWRIGEHMISQGITISCTGNKPENKAGTTPMPAHLKDRLMFIRVRADHEEWSLYAAKRALHPMVRSYIRKYPENLHKFVPGSDSCPTPRSWEKVSNLLGMGMEKDIRFAALCGTVGEGVSHEFETYMRIGDKLPDPDEVIRNPETAPLFAPADADIITLLLASLADKTTAKNIGQVLKYIKRLPNQEFAAVYATDAFNRDESLLDTKEGRDWKMTSGAQLAFG
jgi:hypothetical protein